MTWKTAYLETRVLSADPVELIDILYEYAILNVQEARSGLARGDIAARAKAISKTIAILGELDSSLDRELGGAIASNLARLYQYMRGRLTVANLKRADDPLAEVEALLKTLGEAWHAISLRKSLEKGDIQMSRVPADWGALPKVETTPGYGAHSWNA
ncbi:MAG: flagellar export chaperone FliS [Bryobacteraceae bacterium]|jgi:flagellar secretion chaperone FliS